MDSEIKYTIPLGYRKATMNGGQAIAGFAVRATNDGERERLCWFDAHVSSLPLDSGVRLPSPLNDVGFIVVNCWDEDDNLLCKFTHKVVLRRVIDGIPTAFDGILDGIFNNLCGGALVHVDWLDATTSIPDPHEVAMIYLDVDVASDMSEDGIRGVRDYARLIVKDMTRVRRFFEKHSTENKEQ